MKKFFIMGMTILTLFSCEKKNEVYDVEPTGELATKGACDAEEQTIVDALRDRMVVFSSIDEYLAKADELSGDMDVSYEALKAWKEANRCVLPGVEGELLFMESDMKFGNDLDGSIDWLLANGGKYVEYHTPEHETYAAESGERYLEPVYSHLADRFFLNEDRMFIVGDQVIKNVEDEMLAVNVKEYKDMLGVNSVAEYEANYAPVEVMAYIPEHPSPDDANLAYGQSQYHESVNGNFKMTCEPYVKNYRWALYKAAITGFKMHNYEYSSSRKTWKNKRAKTDYLNSILMGYYFADILYCRSGNKNGSFNAASKKAYQRHYHKNIGMAPNSYPFMNSYTINMSNSKGCIIQIVKEPIFKEWKP